jgi:hypothetical protein
MKKRTIFLSVLISFLLTAAVLIAIQVWYCGPSTGGCSQTHQEYFSPNYVDFLGMYITTADDRQMNKENFGWTYWDCQAGDVWIYRGYKAYAGDGTYWKYVRINSSCPKITSVSVVEEIINK